MIFLLAAALSAIPQWAFSAQTGRIVMTALFSLTKGQRLFDARVCPKALCLSIRVFAGTVLWVVLTLQAAFAESEFEVALRELNQGTPSLQLLRKWAVTFSENPPGRFDLTPDEYAAVIVSLSRKLAAAGEPVEGILSAGLNTLKKELGSPDTAYASLALLDEIASVAVKTETPTRATQAQLDALGSAEAIWGEHPSILPRLWALETELSWLPDSPLRQEVVALRHKRETIESEFEFNSSAPITMGQGVRRQPDDSELVTVHFATNRELLNRKDPARMFSGERSRSIPDLWFGTASVSVPKSPEIMGLPEGRFWVGEVKPTKDRKAVIVGGSILGDRDVFLKSVQSTVRASGRQELFVFIHGFATDWPTAVRRTAAISVSLGVDGAPVLLSWPSRGDFLSYVADANELTSAVSNQFGSVLDSLLESSGAQRIILVAHSMGGRFALSGLERSVRFNKDPRPIHLVFGSPDVDADDFAYRLRALASGKRYTTLYASRADKALQISQRLNQSPRAGDASSRIDVPGLEVIDTTGARDAEWSIDAALAHNDFVISALDDLRAVVWHDMPAENRCILAPSSDPAALVHWNMTPPARCKIETFRFATHSARQMGLQSARDMVEKERKKACPGALADCELWSETARLLSSLAVAP